MMIHSWITNEPFIRVKCKCNWKVVLFASEFCCRSFYIVCYSRIYNSRERERYSLLQFLHDFIYILPEKEKDEKGTSFIVITGVWCKGWLDATVAIAYTTKSLSFYLFTKQIFRMHFIKSCKAKSCILILQCETFTNSTVTAHITRFSSP